MSKQSKQVDKVKKRYSKSLTKKSTTVSKPKVDFSPKVNWKKKSIGIKGKIEF